MKFYKTLRKNLRSRKTRGRKIRKNEQYGGNLNEEQIKSFKRIMTPILDNSDINHYLKKFNRVSTVFDPDFQEYINGLEELLNRDKYKPFIEEMEADGMTAEFINNEIQGIQYHTFVHYTNIVLGMYSHVEDDEPETNAEDDD
jgi:hypothetical protein